MATAIERPASPVKKDNIQERESVTTTPPSEKALMKETAKTILGFGYALKSRTVFQQVKMIEDISDASITVNDYLPSSHAELTASSDEAEKKLQRKIGGVIGGGYPPAGVSGQAAAQIKTSKATTQATRSFFLAATALATCRCHINSEVYLRKDLKPTPEVDYYVKSVTVYTGYNIILKVTTKSDSTVTEEGKSGEIAVSALENLLKLGLSLEELKSKLSKHTFTLIEIVKNEGYGDYTPNLDDICQSTDVDKLLTSVTKLTTDFKNALSSIHIRRFYIDPHSDLAAYHTLSRVNENSDIREDSQSRRSNIPLPILNGDDLFENLAELILEVYPLNKKIALNDIYKKISLDEILKAIHIVFSSTFQGIDKWTPGGAAVIGKSGAGKSLLIGYMLGKELQLKYDEESGNQIYDYMPDSSNTSVLNPPVIGHNGSKTKGCQVHGSFVDTGGLIDLDGPGMDLCNAIAIDMVTKIMPPKHLIVVFPSSVFEERAQGFFDLFKTLKRVVRNEEGDWSSILFVINNKNPVIDKATGKLIGKDFIRRNIQKALLQENRSIESLLPTKKESKGWAGWVMDKLRTLPDETTTKAPETSEIKESVAKKLNPHAENIEILSRITDNNIIVANFDDDQMRKEINNWLAKPLSNKSSHLSLAMENLVNQGAVKFNTALGVTADYFNRLLLTIADLKNKILNVESAMNKEKKNGVPSEPVDRKNKLIADLENLKSSINLDAERKEKNELEDELIKWTTNPTELVLFETLAPKSPITCRKWYHFFIQIRSTFKYRSNVPFSKIEKSKVTGSWDLRSEKSNPDTGEYQIDYCPTYKDSGETCDATIRILLQKRAHPATIARINFINERIAQIEQDLRSIQNLSDEIKNIEANDKNSSDKIASLAKRKEDLDFELSAALAKITPYLEYCKLVKKIIETYKLKSEESTDLNKATFTDFIKNFEAYVKQLDGKSA